MHALSVPTQKAASGWSSKRLRIAPVAITPSRSRPCASRKRSSDTLRKVPFSSLAKVSRWEAPLSIWGRAVPGCEPGRRLAFQSNSATEPRLTGCRPAKKQKVEELQDSGPGKARLSTGSAISIVDGKNQVLAHGSIVDAEPPMQKIMGGLRSCEY